MTNLWLPKFDGLLLHIRVLISSYAVFANFCRARNQNGRQQPSWKESGNLQVISFEGKFFVIGCTLFDNNVFQSDYPTSLACLIPQTLPQSHTRAQTESES